MGERETWAVRQLTRFVCVKNIILTQSKTSNSEDKIKSNLVNNKILILIFFVVAAACLHED